MKWFLLLLSAGSLAAGKLAVLPATVTLSGPEARQQLLAEGTSGNFDDDKTASVKWVSSNPKADRGSAEGIVKQVADG